MRNDQIALQLYTVRQHTARDMLGTLRQVAEMGYRAVEFAGYGGVPLPELRAALDQYGVAAFGAHTPFAAFDADPERVISELHALGCEYAIIPSLPQEYRESAERVRQQPTDRVRRLVDTFNRWGERCREAGLRFGYHNHAFEFEPLGDTTLFDLLAGTDPGLVALELDAFWAQRAGVDPVALLERHGGRIPLLHVKDMAAGPDGADAPVGEGTMAWDRILPAADAAGVRWYVVEQDHPRDPLNDVRRSYDNLARMAQR